MTQDHTKKLTDHINTMTDPELQLQAGIDCMTGEGMPQNYEEAVAWFRKAAEQGNANAQSRLGVAYYNGKGIRQDFGAAVAWFRKATEQGNTNAQYRLGVAYYDGKGVHQDFAVAATWFRKQPIKETPLPNFT